MTKYVFIAKDEEMGMRSQVSSHDVSADELVATFYQFMLSAGFHPTSVIRSLEALTDEHVDNE